MLPPSDPKQLSSQPAIQPPTQSHVPDALPDAGKQIPSTPQNPSHLHSSAPNPIAHPLDQLSQPPVSVPDLLLPDAQSASTLASFTILPAPSVSSSGNVSEKKSSNTSNNTFLTANSVNPLAANALPQPQTAGGAVANAPQIGASSDAPDSLQRKGTTLVSAQSTNLPTATPQSAAIVLAGSTVQTSVQTSVQATPSDLIAPASAHKSDGSTPLGSLDTPTKLPSAVDSPTNPITGPVQMAQMVSKAAQSEMRIGMNTSAFGNVEVRTVVHANDVGVLIGSEKGDLRSFLANELPAIANTLQQQNLRLNHVNFHQQGFGFSNQMSGGDAQQRSFTSKPQAMAAGPSAMLRAELNESTESTGSRAGGGLSILA